MYKTIYDTAHLSKVVLLLTLNSKYDVLNVSSKGDFIVQVLSFYCAVAYLFKHSYGANETETIKNSYNFCE